LRRELADPALYRDRAGEVAPLRDALTAREQALADAYARWEALELRAAAS